MNGKDIFLGLRYVDEDIIEEAEYGTFSTKADASVQEKKRRSIRRPLLIAAVIALAAVLVGCAVVYALRMQDMSIGTETYTQSFDDSGKAIEPVEKTRDILTLYGHSGDAIQSAMKEWYEFTESYDPDGKLMDNNPDHPEIPNYLEWTYSCYTLEMADKLQEIADKYNLKLLEEWIPFQQYQSDIFLEESGIGSLTRPDSGAETSRMAGMFYPPYNFQMEFDLSFDALDHKVSCTALYARKDYFPREFPGGVDLSLFDQWDYTAADGTKLLLALSNKGTAYIIAQPENAMLIYSIDGNFSGSGYPTAEEILTKEELEQIADVFDYSIQPHEVDRAAVQAKLDEAQAEYDAEHTFEPETYGNFSEALKKRVTLPNEKAQYAFYDVTGDGIEDLLIDSAGYGGQMKQITEAEAQAIVDSYTRIDFDWLPLKHYGEPVLSITYEDPYARYIARKLERYDDADTFEYALMDLNGDGELELITRESVYMGDGRKYYALYFHMIKDGELWDIDGFHFTYVCEGGILEASADSPDRGLQESYWEYYRVTEDGLESIERVFQDPLTMYWGHVVTGQEGKTVTEEEAMAVCNSYRRIHLDMKPFTEYPLK